MCACMLCRWKTFKHCLFHIFQSVNLLFMVILFSWNLITLTLHSRMRTPRLLTMWGVRDPCWSQCAIIVDSGPLWAKRIPRPWWSVREPGKPQFRRLRLRLISSFWACLKISWETKPLLLTQSKQLAETGTPTHCSSIAASARSPPMCTPASNRNLSRAASGELWKFATRKRSSSVLQACAGQRWKQPYPKLEHSERNPRENGGETACAEKYSAEGPDLWKRNSYC